MHLVSQEERRVDIGTVAGLVIAVIAIVLGIVLGGGSVGALIDVTSIFVVFMGTLGACVISIPLARILKLHTVYLQSIFGKSTDSTKTIRDLVHYAEVARREGILSLENMTSEMDNEFIVRGIKMAVDGTDPELIQTIMDTELEALMDRHTQGKKILDTIAKYAPAFGMIGTLLGLIFMLKGMEDPSTIGPSMAVALVTTLYGALIANILASPVADKLAAKDAEEVLVKSMIITGVMAIQSGDNPRIVESKLLTFLPPSQRKAFEEQQEAA